MASRTKKYFVTGLLTIIPLWLTWLALSFLFALVVDTGSPLAEWGIRTITPIWPSLADLLGSGFIRDITSLLVVLLFLFFLGWLATRVLGRRLLTIGENILIKIPLVKTIYGGSKKLIDSFQDMPKDAKNVVMINYPSPEMKTVGLLMRTLIDHDTGEKLAAVYVPTTPNPTSGFLELLPYDQVIFTDWSVNEAISFIVSGAAVGPDTIAFSKSAKIGSGGKKDESRD